MIPIPHRTAACLMVHPPSPLFLTFSVVLPHDSFKISLGNWAAALTNSWKRHLNMGRWVNDLLVWFVWKRLRWDGAVHFRHGDGPSKKSWSACCCGCSSKLVLSRWRLGGGYLLLARANFGAVRLYSSPIEAYVSKSLDNFWLLFCPWTETSQHYWHSKITRRACKFLEDNICPPTVNKLFWRSTNFRLPALTCWVNDRKIVSILSLFR